MAFIVCKKSRRHGEARDLFYLVENYRDGGKVKRRTLIGLGESTTLQDAVASIQKEIDLAVETVNKCQNGLQIMTNTARIHWLRWGNNELDKLNPKMNLLIELQEKYPTM